jgi:probable rRNA maturation factor
MTAMARAGRKPARKPSAALTLSVQYGVVGDVLPSRQRIRSWAKAALQTDAQVALRLVGSREGRRLNRDFRGKDYATNVLTFAYPETRPLSGDIVLCAPVIAIEARAQRKAIEAHYAHLVVHGMLHLQGYDHEDNDDARVMEALEAEIVMKLGYADPYETGQK